MRSQAISIANSGTIDERLDVLSPVKRALLEKKLGRPLPGANSFQIKKRVGGSTAPLSFNQEGLLFMEHLEPGPSRYNVSEAIRVSGHVDRNILQKTLNDIVRRHEAFRTVFESDGDPGDHQTMIEEPYVSDLARRLEEALGRTTELGSSQKGGK